MKEFKNIELIWENIDYENSLVIHQYFEDNMDALIEIIIRKTLEKEKFEIGTFKSFWQSGSVIALKEHKTEKELELRLKKKNSFEIMLSVKRSNEPVQIIKRKLSVEQMKLIPDDLIKLMQNIKDLKTPATFFSMMSRKTK